jgi:hypothetical protein
MIVPRHSKEGAEYAIVDNHAAVDVDQMRHVSAEQRM